MFICDECLKKNYKNEESFMKSRGTCEICRKHVVCNDIYHGNLIRKKGKK